MSDVAPTPNPAQIVEPEADVNAAAQNAADDADAHTPDPVQPPVVENLPEPPKAIQPTDADDGLAAIRDQLASLGGIVESLSKVVEGIIEPDAGPKSVPWTHFGSAR